MRSCYMSSMRRMDLVNVSTPCRKATKINCQFQEEVIIFGHFLFFSDMFIDCLCSTHGHSVVSKCGKNDSASRLHVIDNSDSVMPYNSKKTSLLARRCIQTSPTTNLSCYRASILAARIGIMEVKVATYIHPASLQRASGGSEGAQHRGGWPPLNTQ